MSRTFTSRPGVSSQRARGRGRSQGGATFAKPVNQPSVRGKSVRGTQTAPGSRRPGRGAMYSQPPFGARGGAGRGRGAGRGADLNPDQDDFGDGAAADNAQGQSLQQRATHTGAYTVISPNEKKRRQITEQAERGTREYEQYKQQNKPTRVSYVGTVGGGQAVSMEEARQQQMRAHPTKASKLIREQERRSLQKEAEEKELNEKKIAARRKAEQNEQKQKERQNSWKSDMHRVNNAFLDRLEAQSKVNAVSNTADSPSQAPQRSVPTRSQPGAWASSTSRANLPLSPPGGTFDRGGGGEGMVEGARPKYMQPKRTSTTSTSAKCDDREQYQRSVADSDWSDAGEVRDAQFYANLDILVGMFSNYTEAALLDILETSNGSVDDALHLLGV